MKQESILMQKKNVIAKLFILDWRIGEKLAITFAVGEASQWWSNEGMMVYSS